MNSLPIVARELRVTARRSSTYWLRSLTALAVMGVWFFLMLGAHRSRPMFLISQSAFNALGVLALGFCMLAGVVLTADCLSQEKRAGTLGLLFLTDLKGIDVVLGKLVATSVHAFYAVLVIAPVLGISLLFGGVSVGELGRVVLVLIATLFLSLATGLVCSALCREAAPAMLGTFSWVVIQAGVFPCFGWLKFLALGRLGSHFWLLPSPGYAYWAAFAAAYASPNGPAEFWTSILILLCVGGVFLTVACWVLPRAWSDPEPSLGKKGGLGRWLQAGLANGRRRLASFKAVLEHNPFEWLCRREVLSQQLVWMVMRILLAVWLGLGVCAVVIPGNPRSPPGFFILCLFTSFALHLIFKAMVALEAVRRFWEDRQNGNWELLMVTPVPRAAIPAGYWGAMRHCFFGRMVFLIGVNLALWLAIQAFPKPLQLEHDLEGLAMFSRLFLGGLVVLLTDYWALAWVGMRVGLTARSFQRGVVATLAQVMVAPWLAFFLMFFLINGSGASMKAVFTGWFVLGVVNDLWMGGRARRYIRHEFVVHSGQCHRPWREMPKQPVSISARR